ncbi:MAG: hypothetical protein QOE75_224 [Solirubrobacterales bacterium]|jgi:hypothetical protein|nr:hypothetical protein [Solirubrobacterales bacterium]
MSILDDAIREHLELKRAHGADEAELKKLEDEAFGPPQRPDELDSSAEAPTEFLTAPSEVVEEAAAEIEAEGRRVPNIADLQEAPPAQEAEADVPDEPAIEEQPAGEHQILPAEEDQQPVAEEPAAEGSVPEPLQPDGVHTTEEREAIASQPTEMFDVQAEMDAGAAPEAESPSDEELLDAAASEEPRLTPVEPPAPAPELEPEADHEDDEDFFSEQRLSDELNQALEAPVEETEEHALPPLPEPPSEDPVSEDPIAETPTAPVTEEGTAVYDVEGEGSGQYEEEDSGEQNVYEPETGSHDDVLEDTPEFLEDAPDADDAWFEQRPPKDFDFDD